MFWIILGIVIVIAVTLAVFTYADGSEEAFGAGLIAAMFLTLIICIGLAVSRDTTLPDKYTTEVNSILIMNDNVGDVTETQVSHGLLSSMSWSITRQDGHFSFYSRAKDGEVQFKTIPSDGVKLYLDTETPYYEYQCVKDGGFKMHWFSVETGKGTESSCTYYFHIPAGSIKESVSLDGK